ncbi:MAG: methyltransferase, partial [Muribaculaceae bacterium]|nr:methyltransferase [Muribaculaceae bacterium]
MKVGTDGVLLGAWFDMPAGSSVLDVGTGCGLIALMAAQRGASSVDAVEIDQAAAGEARRNVASSPWHEMIGVMNADFITADLRCRYDRIVSNPPFFVTGEHAPDSSRAAARHEGSLTIAALLTRSRALLAPGGRVAMITPADRYDDVVTQAAFAGLDPVRLCRVSTKEGKPPVRIMWEFAVGSAPC